MNNENIKVEVVVEDKNVRNIDKLKARLKEKAAFIRSQRRIARTLKENGNGPAASIINNSLWTHSGWYRMAHIAYCELMGRTRDQIEKPRECHKFAECYEREIERIKTEYAWTPEEIAKYNERKAKREEAVCAR
jgi:hypothetical protein